MTRSKIRQLSLCWLICLAGLGVSLSSASASSLCKDLFQEKKFFRAAKCFRDKATRLESKPKLSLENRSQLFQYLRNSALCLRRLAQVEKSPIKRSYLRLQALQSIQVILQKKYYESTSQKNLAALIQTKLEEKIGWIQLIVTTGSSQAQVKIIGGYKFKGLARKGLSFQARLRPGTYSVSVEYPKQQPNSRVIVLKSEQKTKVLEFKPKVVKLVQRSLPPKRTRPGPLSWVLVGLGGGVIVAGAVVVAVSVALNSANNKRAELTVRGSSNATAAELQGVYRGSQTLYTAGWIVGGAGVATLTSGLIVYGLQPKKTPSGK